MTIKYENKNYNYNGILFETFASGVGILNPTAHDYEDLYADMYVKVVDFIGEKTSRVCTCKVFENAKQKLCFRHNNRIYKLDDFERVAF